MALRHAAASALALALGVGAPAAQGPQGPPKPGPEHKKLERFAGTWKGKGDMRPGPMGPGGAMSWTETCEWFEGGFHLVCRSEGTNPMGKIKGISILGYDAQKQKYTFYGADNSGWSGYSLGTYDQAGKTWNFTSEESFGGKTMQGRFVIKEVSDKKQTFVWEMSDDGKTWITMMEGESTK